MVEKVWVQVESGAFSGDFWRCLGGMDHDDAAWVAVTVPPLRILRILRIHTAQLYVGKHVIFLISNHLFLRARGTANIYVFA